MVVHDAEDRAGRVFAALADATRRDIVTQVMRHEASVSALAERYDMSFAAVQKHVAVLERAGLVTKERRGRERIVRGDVDTIREAAALLTRYEEMWRMRVGRLEDVLAEAQREDAR
jgi:DNA-binding transcriptional ArsR family regulator